MWKMTKNAKGMKNHKKCEKYQKMRENVEKIMKMRKNCKKWQKWQKCQKSWKIINDISIINDDKTWGKTDLCAIYRLVLCTNIIMESGRKCWVYGLEL